MTSGESQNIEYKQSWRDEYLKWICGFANAQGGTIFIGVNDDGSVCGVENAKRLMEDIPNKVRDVLGIVADVSLLSEQGKDYISIAVKESSMPLTYRGKYYYRTGSTLQELGGLALNDFLMDKMNITWDTTAVPSATTDAIDSEAVEYFKRSAIRAKRLNEAAREESVEQVLHRLHLFTDEGKLTIAALLLFGKDICRWNTMASFRIGRFGSSNADLIIQDVVECPLIMMPDRVVETLRSKYLVSPIHYEGLHRVEPLEIPEKALREMLCNSIVHKNYMGTFIQMKVWNDHITIWNEGALPPSFTIETLKRAHESKPRNKLIANAFYLAGLIEAWGRGYEMIASEFMQEGLQPPTFEEQRGGMMATIQREKYVEIMGNGAGTTTFFSASVTDPIDGNIDSIGTDNGKMSKTGDKNVQDNVEMSKTDGNNVQDIKEMSKREKRHQAIISLILKNSHASLETMAEILAVNPKTIWRDLTELKKNGIIERTGGDYGGEWVVISHKVSSN